MQSQASSIPSELPLSETERQRCVALWQEFVERKEPRNYILLIAHAMAEAKVMSAQAETAPRMPDVTQVTEINEVKQRNVTAISASPLDVEWALKMVKSAPYAALGAKQRDDFRRLRNDFDAMVNAIHEAGFESARGRIATELKKCLKCSEE